MVMKFTNNATSTLASGINASVTSLTVATGQGTLFPTLSGDYFFCTLANTAGTIEIIKVTARSSDTFTIVRAQDNTSASSWITGDKVELRLVAASLNNLPKLDEANTFTAANVYGTPTSITLTNATGLPLTTGVTGILGAANGGSGVANNAAMTVTGSGNFAYTRTLTGATNVTLPTTGTLATLAGTETFTNKTLTTPVIASISNSGTITVPTGTDTLVGRATTDTLTNKTLTNPTVTNYVETVVVIGNSGTTQTLSLTSGTVQTVTMTGNCTFTMPTATAGKSFILIATQDGTGSRTAVFTSVKFANGVAPTLTTTATTGVDILTFVANGTSWFGTYAQAFA